MLSRLKSAGFLVMDYIHWEDEYSRLNLILQQSLSVGIGVLIDLKWIIPVFLAFHVLNFVAWYRGQKQGGIEKRKQELKDAFGGVPDA